MCSKKKTDIVDIVCINVTCRVKAITTFTSCYLLLLSTNIQSSLHSSLDLGITKTDS